MKLDKWLTITSRGNTRITANRPDILRADEIALHLLVSIPNTLFFRPTIEAHVVIPPDSAPPLVLDAQIVEQVDQAIRQATGMDVRLSLVGESE